MYTLVINPGGIQELMDGSSQSASYTPEETNAALVEQHIEGEQEETSHHIHLTNTSYWPIILGSTIAVTIIGLLVFSINVLLALFGIIMIFIFFIVCVFVDW